MNDPKRIEKALGKWRSKWITDEVRITIVGCTSEPHEGNKKKFKKFFDNTLQAASRRLARMYSQSSERVK